MVDDTRLFADSKNTDERTDGDKDATAHRLLSECVPSKSEVAVPEPKVSFNVVTEEAERNNQYVLQFYLARDSVTAQAERNGALTIPVFETTFVPPPDNVSQQIHKPLLSSSVVTEEAERSSSLDIIYDVSALK